MLIIRIWDWTKSIGVKIDRQIIENIIVEFILEKIKYMKSTIILLLVLLNVNCSNSYEVILEGLSKNHVLLYNEMSIDNYLDHFQLNEFEYKKNLIEYRNSINEFYKSETNMVTFLLQYENDTETPCSWLKTTNPFTAILTEKDFINNSQGALILIDNYLLSKEQDKIIIPDYFEELSYDKFKAFYKKNKHLTKEELQRAYFYRDNK